MSADELLQARVELAIGEAWAAHADELWPPGAAYPSPKRQIVLAAEAAIALLTQPAEATP